MRRNKVGAILIAVQMAITLAILCNALVHHRTAGCPEPTADRHDDEANVIVIDNQWVGNPPDHGGPAAGRSCGAALLAGR